MSQPTCNFQFNSRGVAFAELELERNGITPHACQVYHKIQSGPLGMRINYATYESLVQSLANVESLRSFRKLYPRPAVPRLGPSSLFNKSMRWESLVGSWVVPFMGADAAMIKLGQSITTQSENSLHQAQANVYFACSSFKSLCGILKL